MIKKKVMEFTTGQMAECSLVGGTWASSMELVNIKRMKTQRYNMEFGRWARGSLGLK